jgi:hypothetical protein
MIRFALVAAALTTATLPASAAGPFDDVLPFIPPDSNTLVLLNVKAAFDSPVAKKENWSDNVYQRYKAGIGFVPPDCRTVTIASQVNLTNMTRDHQIGLIRVTGLPTTKALAERERGSVDTIADMGVVLSPRNMYLTSVPAPAIAVVFPADRQATARWLRHVKSAKKPEIAPYLKQAADGAGDSILTIAVDLADAVDPTILKAGLAVSPLVVNQKVGDVDRLARFIASVQGLTFTAKATDSLTASLKIDFAYEVSNHKETARLLLLELLEDQGVAIEGMDKWDAKYGNTSMTLTGPLTTHDLRRVFSLFSFPGLAQEEEKGETGQPSYAATKRYLTAVDAILSSVTNKKDNPDYNKTATWIDKAAGQIEQLSRNGVDPIASETAFSSAKRLRAIAATLRGVPVDIKEIDSKAYSYSTSSTGVAFGWWGRPYITYNPGSNVNNYQQIYAERAKAIAKSEHKRIELQSQITDLLVGAKQKLADKYKMPF